MAKSKAKPVSEETPKPLSALSEFQNFTVERINRSQLKGAEYNPRTISEKNKRKLKKAIAKNGLIEPLIWNRRTGNIVGGHQRISILDQLEETKDYSLEVAVVDVPLKQEMEFNIALNNTEAQGVFDIDKMQSMFKDHQLDVEATGFDQADMMAFFGENPLEAPGVNYDQMAEELAKLRETHDTVKDSLTDVQDANFFTVLVFKNYQIRKRFTDALELEDNRYVDGVTIAEMMGIDLGIVGPGVEEELAQESDEQESDEFEPDETLMDDANEQESEEG
jgi:hypothetical protein